MFRREWVHTAKAVNSKTGCMSYFFVFNLSPYDSNVTIMKPKAYHYHFLLLRRLLLDILKLNEFT